MNEHDVTALSGATVRSTGGDKIGKVAQVWLDDRSGQPEWVSVRTGLFGTRESFVPLAAAKFDGDELVIDATKDKVSGAPQLDEGGHLSPEDEAQLYSYYGLPAGGAGHGTGTYADRDRTTRDVGTETYATGRDTSGPTTDDAMTRSEERLRAGTETTETGRARLRKHVVTETQQVEVPVSHEEVRLEREPITDANRGDALSGGDITEEEHEVTLMAEKPVVATEAVPVERVRLGKETVTDSETVSGQVRKEEIELDDPTGTSRTR